MSLRSKKFLKDIEIGIKEIQDFTKDKKYDDFISDRLMQLGIERALEIIGEAVSRDLIP